MPDAVENVAIVARVLARMGIDDVVFLGGSTIGLLLTDPGSVMPGVTLDVDVVVDAPSRAAFQGVERRL